MATFEKHFQATLSFFEYKKKDPSLKKMALYLKFEGMSFIKAWNADIVYTRYNAKAVLTNLMMAFFSWFKPVFFEHNTNYKTELAHLKRPFEKWLHGITLSLLKFFPGFHIGVTHEIKSLLESYGFKKTRMFTVQNGYLAPQLDKSKVDLNVLHEVKEKRASFHKAAILCGGGYAWHGLDNILSLFSSCPNILLLVVGPYENQSDMPNVTYLRTLNSETLMSLYPIVDFGIGSFNMDLNKITEGCPLKVREYLCAGIPVLVNYKECASEIKKLQPYIFNLKEDPAAFEKISAGQFDNELIKSLARHYLSWDELLHPIIQFAKKNVLLTRLPS